MMELDKRTVKEIRKLLKNGVDVPEICAKYHKPVMMTNQSFLKFLSPPFVPVYFNNTTGNTWSLVIQVNWTWINSEYGTDVPVANLTMLPPAATASHLINATLVNTRH